MRTWKHIKHNFVIILTFELVLFFYISDYAKCMDDGLAELNYV